jgi:hypothetical protein
VLPLAAWLQESSDLRMSGPLGNAKTIGKALIPSHWRKFDWPVAVVAAEHSPLMRWMSAAFSRVIDAMQ